MRWDDEPRDPLQDLQDFARLTMWKWDIPPALLVNVDDEIIAEERKEQLQRYLADLDAPPRNTFEELRLVVQPRTIRIPLEQFGAAKERV